MYLLLLLLLLAGVFLYLGFGSRFGSACSSVGGMSAGDQIFRAPRRNPNLSYGYDRSDMYVGAAAGAGSFLPNLDQDDDLAHTYTAEAEHYDDVVEGYAF